MVWTVPKRWIIEDDAPNATEMNTYVRDNLRETAPYVVTTKGDILAADGANSLSRQAVGANDTALLVDTSLGDKVTVGSPAPLRIIWQQPRGSTWSAGRGEFYGGVAGDSLSLSANSNSYMSFALPSDFNAILVADIHLEYSVGDGNVRYNVHTEISADGEARDNHNTALGATTLTGIVAYTRWKLDITSLLTNANAGDMVGVRFERLGADGADTETGSTICYGLMVEFV